MLQCNKSMGTGHVGSRRQVDTTPRGIEAQRTLAAEF
jgi:hypothetical protein